MVGSSPRLGRASHHYLSSGGNIKTKAVGRNSESKRLDSIYAWSYFGWLCDSRRLIIEKGSFGSFGLKFNRMDVVGHPSVSTTPSSS